ncbi:MAG: hypothetical protein IT460_14395 [Planctomycetes bacterium]|nr:hypothetical protein [Planctomycetota bacterium]
MARSIALLVAWVAVVLVAGVEASLARADAAAETAARLASPDASRRADAVRSVRAAWAAGSASFAPRALCDALRAALGADDAAVRAAAAASLGDLGLGGKRALDDALADPAAPVRAAACRALTALVAIHEPDERDPMARLLARLDDGDAAVRAGALGAVAAYGQVGGVDPIVAARGAGPRMLALARDADARVRREALRALADVAPYERIWSEPTVSREDVERVRLEGLADAAPAVRAEAAQGLLGSPTTDPARSARLVEVFDALLGEPDADVRWTAVQGSYALTHDAARLAPAVARIVTEADGLRLDAIALVAAMGPDARAAVPALVAVLGEGKSSLWPGAGGWAVEALYDVGPDAEATLPLLADALRSPDAWRREDAAAAVATLHGAPRRRVDVVYAALSREAAASVRAALLRTAAAVAPQDPRLARAVRAALCERGPEPWAAWAAIEQAPAAWRREHGKALRPALQRACASDDAQAAAAARRALAALDGSPPPRHERRAESTPSPVPDPTIPAAEQVARWTEAAERGHGWTTGPVSNPFRSPFRLDLGLTREALDALARLGPWAQDALPTLRRLRADTRLTDDVDAAIARIER